tara:strand:+ start:91 stop:246 length:156 start_codon:yes stop_codon:yes gene_type:complete
MNFKERGITLGDLLIILTFILAITFISQRINEEKESMFNIIQQELITLKNI